MTTTTEVAAIDRDLAELQRKRACARRNGETDYILVLSKAINQKLSERFAVTRGSGAPSPAPLP